MKYIHILFLLIFKVCQLDRNIRFSPTLKDKNWKDITEELFMTYKNYVNFL
jgi:hypothetical protein